MEDLQNFMIQSERNFASTNEAILTLRTLGEPQCHIDRSEPDQRLQKALEIVAFLARRVLSSTKADVLRPVVDHIHQNWTSVLSPWIMFLLETFAVFNGEPRTKHGVEFRDRVLGLIPLLVSFTMCSAIPDQPKEIQDLTQKSPFLFPLMTRIWIKTVAKSHWTWRQWSVRIAETMSTGRDALFPQFVEALKDVHKTDDVVAISIAHLVHQGPDILVHGIDGFWDSVSLLDYAISPATPFYHPFFEQGGIRALINLLSTLNQSEAWNTTNEHALNTFLTAQHVANILLKSVTGSLRAMSDALDFGLIKVFFRAHRLYQYDRDSVASQDPRALTCWKFSQVMERIAGCLVYPCILRRFLRATKIVAKLGMEGELQPRPSYFWPLWQSTASRALDLRTMLDDLSMEARSACFYIKCPLKATPPQGRVKYVRCTSCISTTYCSRRCAKKAWNAHRSVCKNLSQTAKLGRPFPSGIEVAFFRVILFHLSMRHLQSILRQKDSFARTMRKHQRSVVVFDLDNAKSDFQQPDIIRVVDIESAIRDERFITVPSCATELASAVRSIPEGAEMVILSFFSFPSGYGMTPAGPASLPIVYVVPVNQ